MLSGGGGSGSVRELVERLSHEDFLTLLRAVGVRLHRETGGASRGAMGFLAEMDVIQRLRLEKAAALAAGFDAIDPMTGRRLEIKATVFKKGARAAHGNLSRFSSTKAADALLVAVYGHDLTLLEIREVPMSVVDAYLARPGSNARARRVAPAEALRRIGEVRWTAEPVDGNGPAVR